MPATFEPIASQTLVSAQSSFTFNSIPATYTDIYMVCNVWAASSNVVTPSVRFNGDTANYQGSIGYGRTGTPSLAQSTTSSARINIGDYYAGVTTYSPQMFYVNIHSYADTSKWKSVFVSYGQQNNANFEVGWCSGLWKSTSAINSIQLVSETSQNYAIGSTVTLYGIKAA